VEHSDLCGRFSGRVVRGVNPQAKTPAWMADRLVRCGQRPVSALVDISNYVMFELGRPTHIFDLDKIEGGLTVRWAQPGETLELLNGSTVALDAAVGVIADEKGVESLAGIMGGQATAVSDDTRNIYIEAAFWWTEAVAGRSRRFNFSTDAGHRFERGVDPSSTLEHLEHLTALVLEICGGEAGPLTDTRPAMPEQRPVTMRVSRAAKVIGMPISAAECAGVFERLGLEHTLADGVFTVTPPTWRFDLNIEEDLIEEVARVLGFERLPDTPPLAPITARVRTERQRGPFAVRHRLADQGFQETINFSFVEARWEAELAGNADPIRVLNPIAAPLSVMRSSLLGSLVQVLKHNLARKASRVRVFEIGRVFRRDPSALASATEVAGVSQPMRLAALAYGPASPLQWGRSEAAVDFFDLKGDLETLLAPGEPSFIPASHPAFHPGRCAAVQVGGEIIGHIGELHPRWRQAYDLPLAPVLFELDLSAVLKRQLPVATPLPRQQAVSRDLALVGPESVSHDALLGALRDDSEGLVREATLFDIYRPAAATADMEAGERSLAVRLELRSDEATLTEARIEALVAAALARAASRCGVRLRAQGRAAQ
jgi:phenylalanyl-tRNA synthetase beta chain